MGGQFIHRFSTLNLQRQVFKPHRHKWLFLRCLFTQNTCSYGTHKHTIITCNHTARGGRVSNLPQIGTGFAQWCLSNALKTSQHPSCYAFYIFCMESGLELEAPWLHPPPNNKYIFIFFYIFYAIVSCCVFAALRLSYETSWRFAIK